MKISFLVTIIALMIICCTKKGEPSKQGELLKIEQIGKLSVDRSMNGKLVTIEGYVGFCNNSMFVQLGKKKQDEHLSRWSLQRRKIGRCRN